jgi:hypothetical protein
MSTLYCAYGCHIRDGHKPGCEGECRGCLPRPAADGLALCAWCIRTLERDVAAVPYLVAHMRGAARPNAGAKPYGSDATHADPAEGNVLSAAVDAADELHAALASWAHLILEEHPSRLTGPDEAGAWRSNTGDVVGIKPDDLRPTVHLVEWITPLLPWCEAQEWAGETD